jgi:hypothetical protein
MKYWLKRTGLLLVVASIALSVYCWFRTPEVDRCYRQVEAGMTVDQVRQIMGCDEELPNGIIGAAGEFERTWAVGDARITVAFDRNGRSSYKEFGPDFCGVTPLSSNKN